MRQYGTYVMVLRNSRLGHVSCNTKRTCQHPSWLPVDVHSSVVGCQTLPWFGGPAVPVLHSCAVPALRGSRHLQLDPWPPPGPVHAQRSRNSTGCAQADRTGCAQADRRPQHDSAPEGSRDTATWMPTMAWRGPRAQIYICGQCMSNHLGLQGGSQGRLDALGRSREAVHMCICTCMCTSSSRQARTVIDIPTRSRSRRHLPLARSDAGLSALVVSNYVML